MADYFDVFPIIQYANVMTRDITRRTVVSSGVRGDPRLKQPLELRPGMRADTVADRYYGDAGFTWLVLEAATIVDPYWGWYLDDDRLARLAIMRFGSQEEAQRRKRFYATNWADDPDSQITPAGWSVLTEGEQKYYEPVFGPVGSVIAYRRRREDWYVTTNFILDLGIDTSNGSFAPEERVVITVSGVEVGNAIATWSNSTHVYVQSIEGNTSTVGSVITGANSGATGVMANSSVMLTNIPSGEQQFWSPVSEWDWLVLQNEMKREIRLVDSRYQDEAQLELKKLLND